MLETLGVYCGRGYDAIDKNLVSERHREAERPPFWSAPLSSLSNLKVVVAGAGVFGLSAGVFLAEAGAKVEIWDPAKPVENASGVAAGMIAPAAETIFDRLPPSHDALLRAARDGWSGMAERISGLRLDRSGTLLCFSSTEDRDGALQRLAPGGDRLEAEGSLRIFAGGDWRVDPQSAIPALREAVAFRGGKIIGRRLEVSGAPEWDVAIIAAGFAASRFRREINELGVLTPIKGQLVRFSGTGVTGPALRSQELYLVPHEGAIIAGATMEPDRDDLGVDQSAVDAIRAKAVDALPELADLAFEGAAGIRAATPDGLPLVGPSSLPGFYLAAGARRNGWLLAPLVAEILVSYLSGGDGGSFGPIVSPRRRFAA